MSVQPDYPPNPDYCTNPHHGEVCGGGVVERGGELLSFVIIFDAQRNVMINLYENGVWEDDDLESDDDDDPAYDIPTYYHN